MAKDPGQHLTTQPKTTGKFDDQDEFGLQKRAANPFTASLEAGFRGLASSAAGTGELIAREVGADEVAAGLEQFGDEQEAAAAEALQGVGVTRVEDIRTDTPSNFLSDTFEYGAQGLGQLIPSAVGVLSTALIGRGLGARLGAAVARGQAAKKTAAATGAARGETAGAVGGTQVLETGGIFRETREGLVEQGVDPDEAARRAAGPAAVGGAVSGALGGLISPLSLLRGAGGAGRSLGQAGFEGVTEAGQEATALGARAVADESFDFDPFDPEQASRLINAAVLGTGGSFAFQGVGAGARGAQRLADRRQTREQEALATLTPEGTEGAARAIGESTTQERAGRQQDVAAQTEIDDILGQHLAISPDQLGSIADPLPNTEGLTGGQVLGALTQYAEAGTPVGRRILEQVLPATGLAADPKTLLDTLDARRTQREPEAEPETVGFDPLTAESDELFNQELDQSLARRQLGEDPLTRGEFGTQPRGPEADQEAQFLANTLTEGLAQGRTLTDANKDILRREVEQGSMRSTPELRSVLFNDAQVAQLRKQIGELEGKAKRTEANERALENNRAELNARLDGPEAGAEARARKALGFEEETEIDEASVEELGEGEQVGEINEFDETGQTAVYNLPLGLEIDQPDESQISGKAVTQKSGMPWPNERGRAASGGAVSANAIQVEKDRLEGQGEARYEEETWLESLRRQASEADMTPRQRKTLLATEHFNLTQRLRNTNTTQVNLLTGDVNTDLSRFSVLKRNPLPSAVAREREGVQPSEAAQEAPTETERLRRAETVAGTKGARVRSVVEEQKIAKREEEVGRTRPSPKQIERLGELSKRRLAARRSGGKQPKLTKAEDKERKDLDELVSLFPGFDFEPGLAEIREKRLVEEAKVHAKQAKKRAADTAIVRDLPRRFTQGRENQKELERLVALGDDASLNGAAKLLKLMGTEADPEVLGADAGRLMVREAKRLTSIQSDLEVKVPTRGKRQGDRVVNVQSMTSSMAPRMGGMNLRTNDNVRAAFVTGLGSLTDIDVVLPGHKPDQPADFTKLPKSLVVFTMKHEVKGEAVPLAGRKVTLAELMSPTGTAKQLMAAINTANLQKSDLELERKLLSSANAEHGRVFAIDKALPIINKRILELEKEHAAAKRNPNSVDERQLRVTEQARKLKAKLNIQNNPFTGQPELAYWADREAGSNASPDQLRALNARFRKVRKDLGAEHSRRLSYEQGREDPNDIVGEVQDPNAVEAIEKTPIASERIFLHATREERFELFLSTADNAKLDEKQEALEEQILAEQRAVLAEQTPPVTEKEQRDRDARRVSFEAAINEMVGTFKPKDEAPGVRIIADPELHKRLTDDLTAFRRGLLSGAFRTDPREATSLIAAVRKQLFDERNDAQNAAMARDLKQLMNLDYLDPKTLQPSITDDAVEQAIKNYERVVRNFDRIANKANMPDPAKVAHDQFVWRQIRRARAAATLFNNMFPVSTEKAALRDFIEDTRQLLREHRKKTGGPVTDQKVLRDIRTELNRSLNRLDSVARLQEDTATPNQMFQALHAYMGSTGLEIEAEQTKRLKRLSKVADLGTFRKRAEEETGLVFRGKRRAEIIAEMMLGVVPQPERDLELIEGKLSRERFQKKGQPQPPGAERLADLARKQLHAKRTLNATQQGHVALADDVALSLSPAAAAFAEAFPNSNTEQRTAFAKAIDGVAASKDGAVPLATAAKNEQYGVTDFDPEAHAIAEAESIAERLHKEMQQKAKDTKGTKAKSLEEVFTTPGPIRLPASKGEEVLNKVPPVEQRPADQIVAPPEDVGTTGVTPAFADTTAGVDLALDQALEKGRAALTAKLGGNLKALGLKDFGVKNVKLITPTEAMKRTPSLADGVRNYTEFGYFWDDGDGNYAVFLHPTLLKDEVLQDDVIGHEVGHILFRSALQQADKATMLGIRKEYEAWLENAKKIRAGQPGNIELLRQRMIATLGGNESLTLQNLTQKDMDYFTNFEEWFADNVTAALRRKEAPKTKTQTFFNKIADAVRKAYRALLPARTVDAYVQSLLRQSKNAEVQVKTKVAEQNTDAPLTARLNRLTELAGDFQRGDLTQAKLKETLDKVEADRQKFYPSNKEYADALTEVRKLLTPKPQDKVEVTPPPTQQATRKQLVAMHFKMAVGEMRADLRKRYPNGVSTQQLMEDGLRTATTRASSIGPVGTTFRTRKEGPLYKVTRVHKITAAEFKSAKWMKDHWAAHEGWSAKHGKQIKQVKPGATMTHFELVAPAVAAPPMPAAEAAARVSEANFRSAPAPVAASETELSPTDVTAFRAAAEKLSGKVKVSVLSRFTEEQRVGEALAEFHRTKGPLPAPKVLKSGIEIIPEADVPQKYFDALDKLIDFKGSLALSDLNLPLSNVFDQKFNRAITATAKRYRAPLDAEIARAKPRVSAADRTGFSADALAREMEQFAPELKMIRDHIAGKPNKDFDAEALAHILDNGRRALSHLGAPDAFLNELSAVAAQLDPDMLTLPQAGAPPQAPGGPAAPLAPPPESAMQKLRRLASLKDLREGAKAPPRDGKSEINVIDDHGVVPPGAAEFAALMLNSLGVEYDKLSIHIFDPELDTPSGLSVAERASFNHIRETKSAGHMAPPEFHGVKGEYVIATGVRDLANTADFNNTFLHELFHVVDFALLQEMPQEVRDAFKTDWFNMRAKVFDSKGNLRGDITLRDALLLTQPEGIVDSVLGVDGAVTGRLKLNDPRVQERYPDMTEEWFSGYYFNEVEFAAGQGAKWALTSKRPQGLLQNFYANVSRVLKEIWDTLLGAGVTLPAPSYEAFLTARYNAVNRGPTVHDKELTKLQDTHRKKMERKEEALSEADQGFLDELDEQVKAGDMSEEERNDQVKEVLGFSVPQAPQPGTPPKPPKPPKPAPGIPPRQRAQVGYDMLVQGSMDKDSMRKLKDSLYTTNTGTSPMTAQELAVIGRIVLNPAVRKQIIAKLTELSDADGLARIDLDTAANPALAMRYLMAYGHMLHHKKLITLGTQGKSLYGKATKELRNIVGVVSQQEQAEEIWQANIDGRVKQRVQAGPSAFTLQTRFNEGGFRGAVQNAARIAEAGLGLARDLWKNTLATGDERMRATKNPMLIQLADQLHRPTGRTGVRETYLEAKRRNIAKFGQRMAGIFEEMPPNLHEATRLILQGTTKPSATTDPQVTKAVAEVRKLFKDMRDYGREAGLDVPNRTPGEYFPMVFDAEGLYNNSSGFRWLLTRPEFERNVMEMAVKMELITEPELEELRRQFKLGGPERERAEAKSMEIRTQAALAVHQHLIKSDGMADADPEDAHPQTTVFTPQFRYMNNRMLGFLNPQENPKAAKYATELQGFLNPDMGSIMASYIHQGVKRAEYTRRFGVRGERLKKMLKQAEETGASSAQIRAAEHYVQAVMGTIGTDTNEWLHRFLGMNPPAPGEPINPKAQTLMAWAMVMQNIALLPLATLSSMIDPVGISVRSNFSTAFFGFKAAMRNTLRSWAKTNPDDLNNNLDMLSETLGIVQKNQTLDALTEGYGSIYLRGAPRRLNDGFFRMIGLNAWTAQTRKMALASGKKMLVDLHNGRYNSNPERKKRLLDELGLEEADLREAYDGATNDILILTESELAMLVPAEGGERRADVDLRIRQALVQFVNESILNPDASQRPVWGSDPHFMLVFHLKGFMYSFYDRILKRMALEMRNGRSIPMLMNMGAFVGIMIAADAIRNMIQTDFDEDDREWEQIIFDGAERSGLFGLGGLVTAAERDIEYGGVGVESFMGPTFEWMTNELPEILSGEDIGKNILGSMPGGAVFRKYHTMDIWGEGGV